VLHAQDTNDGGERKEVHKNHSRDEVAKEFVDALEGIGPFGLVISTPGAAFPKRASSNSGQIGDPT
jgi:hypothetical protein